MTIVIVDPFSSGRHLAPMLKKCGHTTVAIISSTKLAPFYLNSLVKADFSQIYFYDKNQNEIAKYFKNNNIDHVIAGSEPGVDLACTLSHLLGLPGHNYHNMNARRDKFKMQEAIKTSGIRAVKGCLVQRKDILAATNKDILIPYPLVIKPLRSAGTDGVALLKTADQLVEYFNNSAPTNNVMGEENTEFLLQEYINGTEYVVDAISVHGEHQILAVWRYNKVNFENNIIYNSMEFIPFAKTPPELLQYTKQCLTALGISFGPSHSEIFIDKNGPVLCEVGARVHGGMGPILAKQAISFNQIEAFVDLVCGNPIDYENRWQVAKPKFAIEFFGCNKKPGILKHTYQPAHPEIANFNLVNNVNEFIGKTIDLITSPARLLVVSDDKDKVDFELSNFRKWENEIGYT